MSIKIRQPLMVLLIGGVLVCSLSTTARSQSPGDATNTQRLDNSRMQISSKTRQLMIANQKKQAQEWLAAAQAKLEAVKKIENGPCLCGASSHEECKTPEHCEPIEERMKQDLKDEAERAVQEGTTANNQRKSLEQQDDPVAVLRDLRAETLRSEIQRDRALRDKLQRELRKVERWSREDIASELYKLRLLVALRRTTRDWVSVAGLKDVSAARQLAYLGFDETIESYLADRELSSEEQAGKVTKALRVGHDLLNKQTIDPQLAAARDQLAGAVSESAKKTATMRLGQLEQASRVLRFKGKLYELGIEALGGDDGRLGDDRAARQMRHSRILTKAAGLVSESSAGGRQVALTFESGRSIASFGILAWSEYEVQQAIRLRNDKTRDARSLLLRKIHQLNSHIAFKERKLAEYEHGKGN